jgi:aminoglycoside 3-N-acetyltransferase I
MTTASNITIERLGAADAARARNLFLLMARVFAEDEGPTAEPVSEAYAAGLLARPDFWVLAASIEGELVGGLTAHTLPMTRAEVSEVFIYDLAVVPEQQRRGVGRRLVDALRERAAAAGITVVFVPADDEDSHALDFYRAIGGEAAPVTIFTFED